MRMLIIPSHLLFVITFFWLENCKEKWEIQCSYKSRKSKKGVVMNAWNFIWCMMKDSFILPPIQGDKWNAYPVIESDSVVDISRWLSFSLSGWFVAPHGVSDLNKNNMFSALSSTQSWRSHGISILNTHCEKLSPLSTGPMNLSGQTLWKLLPWMWRKFLQETFVLLCACIWNGWGHTYSTRC